MTFLLINEDTIGMENKMPVHICNNNNNLERCRDVTGHVTSHVVTSSCVSHVVSVVMATVHPLFGCFFPNPSF